jgi:hypothetical protein
MYPFRARSINRQTIYASLRRNCLLRTVSLANKCAYVNNDRFILDSGVVTFTAFHKVYFMTNVLRAKPAAILALVCVTFLSVCMLTVHADEANEPPIVVTPLPPPPVKETADPAVGYEGAFMAIGAGGNGGMFGCRSGGGKKRCIERFGGSKGSEAAVNAALLWFKKHQSPNGMWDVNGYPLNCTEMPQCEPGTQHVDASGDVVASGYAMLCFLGSGYDHQVPSRYKLTVKKGLAWLLSVQQADGGYGVTNEELGIVATALDSGATDN